MNPIGQGVSKALKNRRTCPHCEKQQVVAADKREKTVSCKHCSRPVPPQPRR